MLYPALILCLLPIKHVLFAHVLDVGYSRSRSPSLPSWYLYLIVYLVVEMLGTMIVLTGNPLSVIMGACAVESLVLLIHAWLERHAPLGRELKTHLYGELGMFGLYTVTATFVAV